MNSQLNLRAISFLFQNKQYLQAEKALLQIIAVNKTSAQVWELLAITQKCLSKYKESERSFKRSIKLDPKQCSAHSNLGNLYSQKKEFFNAALSYKKAIELNPSFIDANYNLGITYLKQEKFEVAKQALLKVVKLNSKHVGAISSLGLIYQKQNIDDLAIKYFEQAIQLDPSNVMALQNKGVILKKNKKFKEAIEIFLKAIRLRSDIADIYQNLASSYASIGDIQKAEDNYKKAIKLEPMNQSHHHWYNQLLWTEGLDSFLDSYKDQIEAHPEALPLRRDFASKLTLATRYEEAIEQLRYLCKVEPSIAMNFNLLGNSYREAGHFSESHDAHVHAKKLSPHDLSINEGLATSWLCQNEPQKALKIIDNQLKTHPQRQGLWTLKSTALRLLNSDEYHFINDYEKLVLIKKIEPPKGYNSLVEFNDALTSLLKDYHNSKRHPLDQSLITGTQTIDDLFSYNKELFNTLKASFDLYQDDFFSNLSYNQNHPVLSRLKKPYSYNGSWSVMLNEKGFHKNHFHNKGWYSGPYYVQLPKKKGTNQGGWLKLGEPGINGLNVLKADFEIEPEEGMMIRFPSYMWHGTYPFHTDEQRLTVTVDLEV